MKNTITLIVSLVAISVSTAAPVVVVRDAKTPVADKAIEKLEARLAEAEDEEEIARIEEKIAKIQEKADSKPDKVTVRRTGNAPVKKAIKKAGR